MTPEDESLRSEQVQPGKNGWVITNNFRKNEALGQSRNDAQFYMCLVVKVKSDAVKNNTAQEPGILGP